MHTHACQFSVRWRMVGWCILPSRVNTANEVVQNVLVDRCSYLEHHRVYILCCFLHYIYNVKDSWSKTTRHRQQSIDLCKENQQHQRQCHAHILVQNVLTVGLVLVSSDAHICHMYHSHQRRASLSKTSFILC